MDVRLGLRGLDFFEIGEVFARYGVEFEWEAEVRQLLERVTQLVDGVVWPRERAVSASIAL